VADGKVFTIGVGGVLSCLNAATGKLVWRKDPFPKVVPRFFTSMSPIIVDGMVIAHLGGQGNGAIIAYDLATGSEKWRWAGESPEYASPALLTVGSTKQIVTLAERNIVGVGVADGKLLWQLPFAPPRRAYNAAYTDSRWTNGNLHWCGPGCKGRKDREAGGWFCRQRALEQSGTRPAVQHAGAQGRPGPTQALAAAAVSQPLSAPALVW